MRGQLSAPDELRRRLSVASAMFGPDDEFEIHVTLTGATAADVIRALARPDWRDLVAGGIVGVAVAVLICLSAVAAPYVIGGLQ